MILRGNIPGMNNKTSVFLLAVILLSLTVSGGVFYKRHFVSHRPSRILGMSRDDYQAYQLEYQQLLFENERLSRQLQNFEQAAAQQGTWLNKVTEENLQLRDKISLMERLSRLQKSVSELKEKQARADREKEEAVTPALPSESLSWETLEEARTALEKAKLRIHSVQERMNDLLSDDKEKQLAVGEDPDQGPSCTGNKGYLFHEGSHPESGRGAL